MKITHSKVIWKFEYLEQDYPEIAYYFEFSYKKKRIFKIDLTGIIELWK